MGRASVADPLKVFRFLVQIPTFANSGWSEVTGLSDETDTVEYREGGFNDTPQISAGITKYPQVTLRRGQVAPAPGQGNDLEIIRWREDVIRIDRTGTAENYRKEIDIVQMSSVNRAVRRWRLFNAFPKGVKPFSDLNGNTSENSLVELMIVHEGYRLIT